MSGLIRNLLTLLCAWLSSSRVDVKAKASCRFLITPFDCGISILKSDKYFQLAEAAQVDFLVKTSLVNAFRVKGVSVVNASQLIKFIKPIQVFSRPRVDTQIIFADEKCVYFNHSLFLNDTLHAEVLVKMKCKKGPITVPPKELLGQVEWQESNKLQYWNKALNG